MSHYGGFMSENLHSRFESILRKIGFKNDIEKPVFYNSDIGLRFELGHGKVYIENTPNPIYVSGCLERAEKLLTAVSPDVMRVDVYPDDKFYSVTKDYLIRTLGLPQDCVKDEDVHHLYWSITDINKCVLILRQVILSDIGGAYDLNSCVYFADSSNTVMYYIYDDRGADIVSDNTEALMPVYKKFNEWILEMELN